MESHYLLLTGDDFRDYGKKADQSGKVEVYTERIDDTFIFFVKNAANKKQKFQIEFSEFSNMATSVKTPYVFEVETLTESFIMIVRPIDPLAEWKIFFFFTILDGY